jgi:hypothetical protein
VGPASPTDDVSTINKTQKWWRNSHPLSLSLFPYVGFTDVNRVMHLGISRTQIDCPTIVREVSLVPARTYSKATVIPRESQLKECGREEQQRSREAKLPIRQVLPRVIWTSKGWGDEIHCAHYILVPASGDGYFVASWWRTPLRHPPKVTIDQYILFSTNFRYSCSSGKKERLFFLR